MHQHGDFISWTCVVSLVIMKARLAARSLNRACPTTVLPLITSLTLACTSSNFGAIVRPSVRQCHMATSLELLAM